MVQIWFGNTYLSFAQAESFHPLFGPILMTCFAALSNTLLLTSEWTTNNKPRRNSGMMTSYSTYLDSFQHRGTNWCGMNFDAKSTIEFLILSTRTLPRRWTPVAPFAIVKIFNSFLSISFSLLYPPLKGKYDVTEAMVANPHMKQRQIRCSLQLSATIQSACIRHTKTCELGPIASCTPLSQRFPHQTHVFPDPYWDRIIRA